MVEDGGNGIFNMDALLTILVDAVFYFFGKGAWLILRFLRAPVKDLGHSGYVVAGLLLFIFILIVLFILWGSGCV